MNASVDPVAVYENFHLPGADPGLVIRGGPARVRIDYQQTKSFKDNYRELQLSLEKMLKLSSLYSSHASSDSHSIAI